MNQKWQWPLDTMKQQICGQPTTFGVELLDTSTRCSSHPQGNTATATENDVTSYRYPCSRGGARHSTLLPYVM